MNDRNREPAGETARSPAGEFMKMSSEMRFPPVNQQALLNSFERNMDAFSEAARLAFRGAQAVAQRQMEFMQQAMTDFSDGVQAASASGAQDSKAAGSADSFRRAYENALSNGREIVDLVRRCNRETMNPLHRRLAEAINELPELTRVG
jgi:phasin family protein